MSRPDINRQASPSFFIRAVALPNGTQDQLLELLGFHRDDLKANWSDEHRFIIWNIENVLGLYDGLEQNREPTTAEYRLKIEKLQENSFKLLNQLQGLDSWTQEKIFSQMDERHQVAQALGTLIGKCGNALKPLETNESRGRPEGALRRVALELAGIFQANYKEQTDDASTRQGQGAVKAFSKRQQDELAFVEAALVAGRITCPDRESLRKHLSKK